MKITAIQKNFYHIRTTPKIKDKNAQDCPTSDSFQLPSLYYPCTTFLGIANSGKLKTLFSYGLPCMYSGIEMIDPKKIQKFLRTKTFESSSSNVIEKTKIFKNSLQGIEAKVFNLLEKHSETTPNNTVQEIFRDIAPNHQSILRKQQAPIFQRLIVLAKDLPEGYRYKFIQLMHETQDKLADRPVFIPFSTSEFQYKLNKIKEDVEKIKNPKANKVMKKLTQEAELLPNKNAESASIIQNEILNFMTIVLRTSILKLNEPLNALFENAIRRINGEKIQIPFTRKSFIYDLSKILEELPDEKLKEDMLNTAERLPTSRDSISAYITKFAKEPSEKIVYRLLWPSMASVEHIFPKSCGGIDDMSNFGGACTRENSDRKSIDFVEQIKRKPETAKNCQKYVDRLIQLAKSGVFSENNINTNYIEEFKNTIFEESKGQIVLDISNLYLS